MGYSFERYESLDGATDQFGIPFGFLRNEHVHVYLVEGVESTEQSFSWVTASSIQVDAMPPVGSTIVVRRETPIDSRTVDYTSGSILQEQTLDEGHLELFYIAQEAVDNSANALSRDSLTNLWSADNTRITNVSDPVNPQDVVTKGFFDATYIPNMQSILGQTETARDDAQTAQGLAEDAQGHAETAQGLSEDAQGLAETARDEAQAISDGIVPVGDAQVTRVTDEGDTQVARVMAEGDTQFARADAEADRAEAEADKVAGLVNVNKLLLYESPGSTVTLDASNHDVLRVRTFTSDCVMTVTGLTEGRTVMVMVGGSGGYNLTLAIEDGLSFLWVPEEAEFGAGYSCIVTLTHIGRDQVLATSVSGA